MTASLPRMRFHSPALLLALWAAIPGLCNTETPSDVNYAFRITTKTAFHTSHAADLAMNRAIIEAEQQIKRGRWSAMIGGMMYADSAFAMNSRYDAPIRTIESGMFAPRDIYLQYKGPHLQLRLGSQQVAWGESYGFFFADIVNPKDTREGALGGDLTAQRVDVPMLNAVGFFGDYSLQLLYLPVPILNLTPSQGSDFAVPLGQFFQGYNISVQDIRLRPFAWNQGEIGLRGSTLLAGWDLALFYMSYYDRRPSWRPSFSGSNVAIQGIHDPISSIGFTGTKDLETWVARFELLYTMNRPVDAYSYNPITPTLSYYSGLSDEFVGVIGFDYTQWKDWHLTLQIAQDSYFKKIPGSLIPQNSTNFSVVVGGTVFNHHELNIIASAFANDGSSLWQVMYMIPVSQRLEATFGTYLFEGGSQTMYGAFQRANRAFFQLRGYFGGL